MNLMQLIESKGWSFEYDTEGNQAALITKCGTRIPAQTDQYFFFLGEGLDVGDLRGNCRLFGF